MHKVLILNQNVAVCIKSLDYKNIEKCCARAKSRLEYGIDKDMINKTVLQWLRYLL